MDADTLARLRARAAGVGKVDVAADDVVALFSALCDEVDRLRAENAALRAVLEGLPEWVLDEIAGWRGIVLGLNAVAASTADALRAHLAEVRR